MIESIEFETREMDKDDFIQWFKLNFDNIENLYKQDQWIEDELRIKWLDIKSAEKDRFKVILGGYKRCLL